MSTGTRWVLPLLAAALLSTACSSGGGGPGGRINGNAGGDGDGTPAGQDGADDGDAPGGDDDAPSNGADGAQGADAATPIENATVVLPSYPYFDNDAITPDPAVLAEQGGRWCASNPDDKSAAAFYYGWMPLDTVDKLCDPRQQDWPSIEKLMGNMYLSGYFGGIWFRDNAQSGGGRPAGTGQGATSESTFQDLAKQIRERIDLSTTGSDEDVLAFAFEASDPNPAKTLESTPIIYGYNKGYAQAVLNNAPQDVQDAPPFACDDYLDCKTPGVSLATFERFRPALPELTKNAETCGVLIGSRPTDTAECRWAEMQDRVDRSKTYETLGGTFWLGGDFTAETYKTLLTINAGYLLVAGAAFVGFMQGYADEKPESARCALLVDTAAYIWNQGYFQGLNSDQQGRLVTDGGVIDLAPQVACPGEAVPELPLDGGVTIAN